MKVAAILLITFSLLTASPLKTHSHYSCVSPDNKGEVYIYLKDKNHIIGDDIDLTYDRKLNLFTGVNGFKEKIVIGLKNDGSIVFGTSTIKPEVWKCTELYGKVPTDDKD
jgi:hypothetical protein